MSDRAIVRQIFQNRALLLGATTPISAEITGMGSGKGVFAYLLEITLTLVVGTGTGAIAEGELGIIRNVQFSTDIDKQSHNAAGRALYRTAHFEKGIAPNRDVIAASNGTYRVQIPLIFSDENSLNPFDSILSTRRYKAAELFITLGTIADLLSSPGTATVTATCSLSAVETRGVLEEWQQPEVYPFYRQLPAVSHAALNFPISRQADLRLRRLLWMSGTSPVAGVPFSGTPVEDSINRISVEHNYGFEFEKVLRQQLADDNIREGRLITARPVGWYMLDFMKDGDLANSLNTDDAILSKLEMNWEVESGTAANINPLANFAQALKPIGD